MVNEEALDEFGRLLLWAAIKGVLLGGTDVESVDGGLKFDAAGGLFADKGPGVWDPLGVCAPP